MGSGDIVATFSKRCGLTIPNFEKKYQLLVLPDRVCFRFRISKRGRLREDCGRKSRSNFGLFFTACKISRSLSQYFKLNLGSNLFYTFGARMCELGDLIHFRPVLGGDSEIAAPFSQMWEILLFQILRRHGTVISVT